MVLLHLFDESQTILADFGYIPECKSKNSERSKRDIVASRENDSLMGIFSDGIVRRGRAEWGVSCLQKYTQQQKKKTKKKTRKLLLLN